MYRNKEIKKDRHQKNKKTVEKRTDKKIYSKTDRDRERETENNSFKNIFYIPFVPSVEERGEVKRRLNALQTMMADQGDHANAPDWFPAFQGELYEIMKYVKSREENNSSAIVHLKF